MIEITEKAAAELKRIMAEQKSEDSYVRISLKGGGCAGFSYNLDFAKDVTDFDLTFESNGLKVLVDKKSHLLMNGTVVDFHDGILDRGFRFNNPVAKTTCSCGISFST
jgi:iron-sulfur cluster assembly protein